MRLGVLVVDLQRLFGNALRVIVRIATEVECGELGAHFGRLRIGGDGFLERRLGAFRVALRLEVPRNQEIVVGVGGCLRERNAWQREKQRRAGSDGRDA